MEIPTNININKTETGSYVMIISKDANILKQIFMDMNL